MIIDTAGLTTLEYYSYLSIGLVFCCFGQFENSLLNLKYIFPQANASSSGGKLSANDEELSFTGTRSQKKSKSETK